MFKFPSKSPLRVMVFWANSNQQHKPAKGPGSGRNYQLEPSTPSWRCHRTCKAFGWKCQVCAPGKIPSKAESSPSRWPELLHNQLSISLSILSSKASKQCTKPYAFCCLMEISQNSKARIKKAMKETWEQLTAASRKLFLMHRTIKR